MRKKYKKILFENDDDFEIGQFYGILDCDCGNSLNISFEMDTRCIICDRIYGISLSVYELIEEEIEEPGLIGIIADDLRISRDFLSGLSSKIPLGEIEGVKNNPRELEITLKSGDVYRIFTASDERCHHLKGLRFKKLYVHTALREQRFLQDLEAHCDKEIDYFVL